VEDNVWSGDVEKFVGSALSLLAQTEVRGRRREEGETKEEGAGATGYR
jgi:hypothetical protein